MIVDVFHEDFGRQSSSAAKNADADSRSWPLAGVLPILLERPASFDSVVVTPSG